MKNFDPPKFKPGDIIASNVTMCTVTTAFRIDDEWCYVVNDIPVNTDDPPKPGQFTQGNRYIKESEVWYIIGSHGWVRA